VRCDAGKSYRFDGVYFNLTLFHPVASAYFYVGTHPDAHAAGDLSVTNTFTQPPGEHHRSECTPAQPLGRRAREDAATAFCILVLPSALVYLQLIAKHAWV
jgi:hypothetical protein